MECNSNLEVYRMSFDGHILNRGFWLYIWKISTKSNIYLYIGRTGDSSSPNAASPFNRIGQHLDFRNNAKGNSMAKRLKEEDIDPSECNFEMFAIGPVFPEQSSMKEHIPFRDTIAAIEFALSEKLRKKGYTVLGTHASKKPINKNLLENILNKFYDYFE